MPDSDKVSKIQAQQQADLHLHQALVEHAKAYDMERTGEALSEYGVICVWQKMDGHADDVRYTTHFHVEAMPVHAAVGLFRTALAMCFSNDDDEDDT